MAVAHRRDIRSIRDLKPTHVGFLEHLHKRIMEGVPAKYPNVNADQLKIYVHYQPSYYHFHVHVVPRRRKDGLKGFFWPRYPYKSEEEADLVQSAIRAAI